MSKIIIAREVQNENDFTPYKELTYKTKFKPELIQDLYTLHNSEDMLVEVMVENYEKLLREAVRNYFSHPNKQIIVEDDNKTKSEVIVNQTGTASLSFSVDETTIVTIRGNEKCEPK